MQCTIVGTENSKSVVQLMEEAASKFRNAWETAGTDARVFEGGGHLLVMIFGLGMKPLPTSAQLGLTTASSYTKTPKMREIRRKTMISRTLKLLMPKIKMIKTSTAVIKTPAHKGTLNSR